MKKVEFYIDFQNDRSILEQGINDLGSPDHRVVVITGVEIFHSLSDIEVLQVEDLSNLENIVDGILSLCQDGETIIVNREFTKRNFEYTVTRIFYGKEFEYSELLAIYESFKSTKPKYFKKSNIISHMIQLQNEIYKS